MKTVLFIVSSTRHSCKGRLEGIFRYAVKHSWHVQVVERAFHEINVKEELAYWKPIGVIAECGSGAGELNRRAFGKLPVVYFDCDPRLCKGEMSVALDSGLIGEMASKELLSLGLENYAYVPARRKVYWCREREKTFAAAVRSEGRNFFRFDCDYEATQIEQAAALENWLAELPKPCGIFAANDNASLRILTAAAKRRLRIPSQIAVLGVDNDEQICETSRPTLSSIVPDFEEGGYLAGTLLGRMITSGETKREAHLFKASCIARRKSTRCVRGASQTVYSGSVARGLDFIMTDAGKGIGVADVVHAMGVARCTAEILFRQQTGITILTAINNRIFELAQTMLAEGSPTVQSVAEQLVVSRNTLDRIFIRHTGAPAGKGKR